MFSFKVHDNSGTQILAIADAEIIGKSLAHNDLEIEVKESFYGSETADEKKILELVKTFSKSESSINIIGNRIIELLIKHGLITHDSVINLSGTKHCQIYVME